MRSNGKGATLHVLSQLDIGLQSMARDLPEGDQKRAYLEAAEYIGEAIRKEARKEGAMADLNVLVAAPKYA